MTIGEKLKSLRKQNRMTLEDVANYINVGRATILKYENGMITNIPSDKIEQLARLFNVSPAFLMGWSEDHPDDPLSVDQPKNDDIRLLVHGLNKLTPEQVEQAKNVMKVMFAQYADYFDKGE